MTLKLGASFSMAAMGVALAVSAPALGQDAATKGVVTAHRMSAALANEMVAAAVGACAAQSYKVSAVVLDVDGVRQAQLRGDGAGVHTLDSSFYKAYTAVSFGADTIDLVEQAKSNPARPS